MQSQVPRPLGGDALLPEQLVVILLVDVLLVLVETHHLAIALDFAVGVIGAIALEHVAADAVPGVIGVFHAAKGDKAHTGIAVEVTGLGKVTLERRASAIAVAIAANVAHASLKCPVIPLQATAYLECLLVSVERAERSRNLGKRNARESLGAHVDAGSEGTGTIGRRAHATLHLDIGQ